MSDVDLSSLSCNPNAGVVVKTTHLTWDAHVDFDERVITATALYDVEIEYVENAKEEGKEGGKDDLGDDSSAPSPEIWLDTRGLSIGEVKVDGEVVPKEELAEEETKEEKEDGKKKGGGGGGRQRRCWKLEPAVEGKDHLGRRLVIPLSSLPSSSSSTTSSERKKKTCKVSISYKTSSDPSQCTAIQWLPPSQTSGKIRPYLFTQCQAIHARSVLPCMDRPAVKFTYQAKVDVPGWSTAVMSALPKNADDTGKDKEGKSEGGEEGGSSSSSSGRRIFEFDQPVPIPSYLLALAVGQLSSVSLSPRTRVYSEPSTVEAAASEFAKTEDFLRAAEDLTHMSYPWTRYDLLCLPPSFPYGGMENPCLTFVTPTLLAGDGSLADVIAHEISHSWTGNLVTNATWSHFWLNEGWTMWLQRKIMSHPLVTSPQNAEGVFGLDGLGGWKHLQDDVALHGGGDSTKLELELGDGDPDESYSSVPYEKGFNLLRALELRVGEGPFLTFAREYINTFKFGTVTSQEFRDFFTTYFAGKKEGKAAEDFDWETWLHGTGMPPSDYDPKFDRSLAADAEELAEAWLDFDSSSDSTTANPGGTIPSADITPWSTSQRTWFLDVLLKETEKKRGEGRSVAPLSKKTVAAMAHKYGLHKTQNAEVLFRYLMLAVPSATPTPSTPTPAPRPSPPGGSSGGDEEDDDDIDVLATTVKFITTQGRMKYVRPLYRAMRDAGSAETRDLAVRTFLAHREFYHPIAAKMVASDLSLSSVADGGEVGAKEEEGRTNVKRGLLVAAAAAVLAGVALVGVSLVRAKKR